MAQVICQKCNAEFEAKRSDAKYCSDACKLQARRDQARQPDVLEQKRQKNREYAQERRDANPEKSREEKRNWYAAKREQYTEYHRNYKKEHPDYQEYLHEYNKKRNKAFREEHPDLKKQLDAEYYQRNKEKVTARTVQWRQDNPENARRCRQAYVIRYRARLAQAEGDWTPKQFLELCEQTDNYCWHCHQPFDKLTADHMQPVSRRGSNDISNIAPSCGSCNYSKQDKTPLEFHFPLFGRLMR